MGSRLLHNISGVGISGMSDLWSRSPFRGVALMTLVPLGAPAKRLTPELQELCDRGADPSTALDHPSVTALLAAVEAQTQWATVCGPRLRALFAEDVARRKAEWAAVTLDSVTVNALLQ